MKKDESGRKNKRMVKLVRLGFNSFNLVFGVRFDLDEEVKELRDGCFLKTWTCDILKD